MLFVCAVLALKLASIICGAMKYKRLVMLHTVMNKIVGFFALSASADVLFR